MLMFVSPDALSAEWAARGQTGKRKGGHTMLKKLLVVTILMVTIAVGIVSAGAVDVQFGGPEAISCSQFELATWGTCYIYSHGSLMNKFGATKSQCQREFNLRVRSYPNEGWTWKWLPTTRVGLGR